MAVRRQTVTRLQAEDQSLRSGERDSKTGATFSRRTVLQAAGLAGGALALGAMSTATMLHPSGARAQSTVTRGGTLTWAYSQIPQKLDPVWTQARTDST